LLTHLDKSTGLGEDRNSTEQLHDRLACVDGQLTMVVAD